MHKLSPVSAGILLSLLAFFLYTASDTLIKALGSNLSAAEIGLFVALFTLIPFTLSKGKNDRWRDTFKYNRPWIVQLIGLMRASSSVAITYAFVTIPLAEAYAIAFLIPLFTTILSVLVLKEKVPIERWVLVIIGFIGILVVVRPGFRELELGHFTALICAACASVTVILLRITSGNEKRSSICILQAFYIMAANLVLLGLTGFTMPSWDLLLILLCCGLMGGIAYLVQMASLARAPASILAPFQYSQFIWGLLFGAVFFSELPDFIGFVGVGIVIASGVGSVFSDRMRASVTRRWGRANVPTAAADDLARPL